MVSSWLSEAASGPGLLKQLKDSSSCVIFLPFYLIKFHTDYRMKRVREILLDQLQKEQ